MQVLQQDLLIDEQKVIEPNPTQYKPDQHTNIKRGKSVVEYIHYVHDIISIYPYYCRLYMKPQIPTACTRDYNVE